MALVDAAIRARLNRARQYLNRIMLAHDQDFSVGHVLAKKTRRFQTIEAGHTNV